VLKACALAVAVLATATTAAAQGVRTLAIDANDLAYSPLTGRLYASVGAANSITEIDPVAGTIGTSFVVGSQPNRLAVSDTGEYLYVGLNGLPGVVRVHLPTRTVGTPFALGTPDPSLGARSAADLAVLPGNPHAVAVVREYVPFNTHAGVAIYEHGVERPVATGDNAGSTSIAFGKFATRLYGLNGKTSEWGYRRMDVGTGGVTVVDVTTALVDSFNTDIDFLLGRIVTSDGTVIDAEGRAVVGRLAGLGLASALNVVEPAEGTFYFVTNVNSIWRLRGYHPVTLGVTVDRLVPGADGFPRSLAAAGAGVLAMATTGGEVLLITPALLPAADPAITITGPTTDVEVVAEMAAITLTGTTAASAGDVVRVSWSTSRGYSGEANGTTAWTAGDVPLVLGSNLITVTATDTLGRAGLDAIEVVVPWFSSFLAEGATGDFFDYDLALANPTAASVDAELGWYPQSGAPVFQTVTLPPQSRRTIRVDEVTGLGAAAMSTRVGTTTAPILVERTMRWGTAPGPQYGAHGDRATAGAARTWYFAEGAQGYFFTYLLLANPEGLANTATIDWLIEGGPPVRRTVNLPPSSRTTIDAGADAALVGRSFGIVVTFAQPAVAERAMYFGTPPDDLFKAGHDSAGITAPSTRWFLAEGATGPFFHTFVLLANPNSTAVDVTLRFLTHTGTTIERTLQIPAQSRRTVDLENLSPAAPELANAAVATVVEASQPIVAERAQYWPGVGSEWYEAHNSFGLPDAKLKWGLAEGRVGNPPGVPPAGYQTYILLANPGTLSADVTVRFLRESGSPVVKTFTVPAGRRLNVAVAGAGSSVPELVDEMFGAAIESTQPIAVERALYGNAGAQVFGLGTNVTATPLP
jgi:hypothetical protein